VVFDRIVEQAGCDRDVVHSHLDENSRDFERVDEVRLSGKPLLAFVHLGAEHVGALKEREIARGVVLQDAVSDVVETQHPRRDSP
jgi:hypothetical protein